MEKLTVYFQGNLRTETPFANSPEGNKGPNKEQLLPRMPINIGGGFRQTVFVPASTLRGKIRRAAARVLLARFDALGEPVSFDDWLLWSVGGVKGSDDERVEVRRRAAIIEASALLAMFGAGDSPARTMVGARLHVDPGLPQEEIPATIVKGARGAENRNPELVEFLDPGEIDKVQAYTDANRDRSQLDKDVKEIGRDLHKAERAEAAGKGPGKEAIETQRTRLEKAQRDLQEAVEAQRLVGSDNAIGRPLPGYEVIPAGAVFPHRMVAKAATPLQIGFVLAALREFALDPVIGAHVSDGCGRISAQYHIQIRRGRGDALEAVGRLAYGDLTGLSLDGTEPRSWLQLWDETRLDPAAYRAAARNSGRE